MNNFYATFLLGLMAVVAPLCSASSLMAYKVLDEKLHDEKAFTQGFIVQQKMLYESSGLFGESYITVYDKQTNQISLKYHLPKNIFAEGLTVRGDTVYVLSWKNGTLLTYDKKTFSPGKTYSYTGEGWGLTHTEKHFAMSDGSSTLFFRRFSDFAVENTLTVSLQGTPVQRLNELEYAKGYIWANVWQKPLILKIHPDTGIVEGVANLKALLPKFHLYPKADVLNGIAYDLDTDAFWVTGKFWPKRYLIQFDSGTTKNP
ncbi:glutaminyl-peptide cyclotransferase [Teredinibacter sp. KSP-S5-2]|uniref:glutaminyl-peptide cyclotransferase n=1 Tax=Teredinibacter sp. KSP-S5-2 TaxID=3034506 RepID=UPI0029342BAD|nr:glutaminyl-peptide cyclotransferase [Teredinibacter sp. KSP-S5-2]WNO07585.1 glutaminyl-peptide cyclotransferase [Teredinibacter sp. KSP-S5-2]